MAKCSSGWPALQETTASSRPGLLAFATMKPPRWRRVPPIDARQQPLRSSKLRLAALGLLGVICWVSAPLTSAPQPAEGSKSAPPAPLEWLGAATLPFGTTFDRTLVGGLSGLVWDPGDGAFYALSDDRGEHNPVRFYRLAVDLSRGWLADGDVRIEGVTFLSDGEHHPYPRRGIDPEGFARDARGTFYFASEGAADRGIAPFVAALRPDGSEARRFPLPPRYAPDGDERHGVRENRGFESLTVTPDQRYLVAALENALTTDGPAADVGVSSLSRILLWPLAGGAPREVAYRVEPVSATTPSIRGLRVNGLSDLLALSADRFLALERQYVAGAGLRIRLYRVSLAGATDVSNLDDLGHQPIRPAAKELLVDLADLGVPIENYEGMALGPRLPDGRRTLVMVSDDNFNPLFQRTRFVAFAVAGRILDGGGRLGAGR